MMGIWMSISCILAEIFLSNTFYVQEFTYFYISCLIKKKIRMRTKLLYVVAFLVTSFSLTSQNLLNTNTWTVGSGSVSGFSQNGTTSENSREYGASPKGTSELLWKGKQTLMMGLLISDFIVQIMD